VNSPHRSYDSAAILRAVADTQTLASSPKTQDELRRIAAEIDAREKEQRAWLLENSEGEWWTGDNFTRDPNKAIRFARDVDAGHFAYKMWVRGFGKFEATEHLWIDGQKIR
jgi:hypothetical protein